MTHVSACAGVPLRSRLGNVIQIIFPGKLLTTACRFCPAKARPTANEIYRIVMFGTGRYVLRGFLAVEDVSPIKNGDFPWSC